MVNHFICYQTKPNGGQRNQTTILVHSTFVIQYYIRCIHWIRLPYSTNYTIQYWLIVPLHSLQFYIHTLHLYLHLKYITVHHTFSDTTVFVHSSLFLQLLSHSTVKPSPRLSVYSSLSGKERKREKEEGRGRGKYFSCPSHHCTVHTVTIHNTLICYLILLVTFVQLQNY